MSATLKLLRPDGEMDITRRFGRRILGSNPGRGTEGDTKEARLALLKDSKAGARRREAGPRTLSGLRIRGAIRLVIRGRK